MSGSEVPLAALGVVATVAAALVWLLKKLFNQNDGTIKQNNSVLNRLASSIDKSAEASTALQISIKERDVRDREFHERVMQSFDKVTQKLDSLDQKADRNFDAVRGVTVKTQNVEQQIVKHEVVREKT